MGNAALRLRKLIFTPPSGKPFLVVEVEIELPTGVLEYQIPGQFVATLATHLTAIQAAHPALCGVQGTVKEQVTFGGSVDHGKVGLN